MAHELEIFSDGSASMFSARQMPWHQLGTITPDALTAEDAMTAARLDWTVEKHPLQTVIAHADGVTTMDVPGRYATVRTHPETGQFDVLGDVGEYYTVIQNIENANYLNALVNESGAHFETAGSLRGGKRVFVTMKMPEDIKIGGQDPIDLYLVATNSHDGTSAFTVAVTPIRVVCQNTLNFALNSSKQQIRIRHTSTALDTLAEARTTLGITSAYIDEFQAMSEKLLATPVTEAKFDKIIDRIWEPKANTNGEPTKATTDRKLELVQLFTGAETNEFGRGTAWGALNAITEYTDWFTPVRENGRDHATQIAEGALATLKAKALGVLTRVR